MEIPQNKALEIIGAQQVEITVLRERVALFQQHRCEPCERQHVDGPMAGEEAPGE